MILAGLTVSHIFNFLNRSQFVAHVYQSANSLLESGNQVCIYTPRRVKQLSMTNFNCLRLSSPSVYKGILKEIVFLSINLICCGDAQRTGLILENKAMCAV